MKVVFLKYLVVAAMVFSAALVVSSCGDKDDADDNPKEFKIENSEALNQELFADETGGIDLTFTTTGAWTSTKPATADWVSILPDHGEAAGEYTVEITVAPNATGSDRSAAINFVCNDETITVNVSQKATKEDGTPYEPSGNNSQYDPKVPSNMYVVGSEMNAQNKRVAKLWNNGEVIDISDGTNNATANSVFVLNGDVYIAGAEEIGGKTFATLWKNGEPQELNITREFNSASARSVFVAGSDVYVAGSINIQESRNVAILWKNGEPQYLSSGRVTSEYANSVFVTGSGDVYVAGEEGNGTLWKNGVQQNGTQGQYSVFISDNDIYTAGIAYSSSVRYTAVWKNGEVQRLGEGNNTHARGSSVYVSGSDVYVAGHEGGSRPVAKLYKNGVLQDLALTEGAEYAYAYSVCVFGSDVYVAGMEQISLLNHKSVAKLWKNGVAQNLTDGARSAGANSIFIVK